LFRSAAVVESSLVFKPMSRQKKESPAAASDTEATPRLPIVFSENVIVRTGDFEGSHFIRAGDPSPFCELSEVPESLKVFVASAEPPQVPEEQNFANYSLGECGWTERQSASGSGR
jgi:hypothetical protein